MNRVPAWHLGLLLISVTWGCVAHVDNLTKFHFEAKLVDQESGIPLEEGKAFFIDTGFDHVRSKRTNMYALGQTNEMGTLSTTFSYFWGWKESFFSHDAPQTFVIKFERQAYKPLSLALRAADFPTTGNEVSVNVGVVRLRKDSQALPAR